MNRTQVHLSDRHLRVLDRARRDTGASRSELIRRAIEVVYEGGGERPLPRSLGVVTDGSLDASTVKERIRREWAEDLRR